jgi:hypothetical protein
MLRSLTEAAKGDRDERHRFRLRARTPIRRLSDLLVKEKRKEYFERVDMLRALGQGVPVEIHTATSTGGRMKLQSCYNAICYVADYIQRFTKIPDERNAVKLYSSARYLALLLAFGLAFPLMMIAINVQLGIPQRNTVQSFTEVEDSAAADPPPTCLLCNKSFTKCSNLTRHYKEAHFGYENFEEPFPCPECRRRGTQGYFTTGCAPA